MGIVEPGYPCYRNALVARGLTPVPIAVGDAARWAPTPGLIAAAGPLDGLVLASPSNPTGTVLGVDALGALVDHCSAHGIKIVADEIDPASWNTLHHRCSTTTPTRSSSAASPSTGR